MLIDSQTMDDMHNITSLLMETFDFFSFACIYFCLQNLLELLEIFEKMKKKMATLL